MTKYSKDYTSLKHQNKELFKACEEAGSFAALEKLIMVIPKPPKTKLWSLNPTCESKTYCFKG